MAKKKLDFSEYQMSDIEKRNSKLNGNSAVSYAYFINEARFNPEEREFTLFVDPANEDWYMKEDMDEYAADEKNRREIHEEIISEEERQEREELRLEELEYNEKMLKLLESKYCLSREIVDSEIDNFYVDHPDIPRIPLNNVLSGARVKIKYGEGILDFIYADFHTPAKKALEFRAFISALNQAIGEKKPDKSNETATQERAPEKIYNRTQIIVEDYLRYQSTVLLMKDIGYASLYTTICPPLFKDTQSEFRALKSYYDYLCMLQKEYLDMLEFCFDDNYYPEVLGHMAPSERWFLFRRVNDWGAIFSRKETVSFSTGGGSGTVMPYGLPAVQIFKRIGNGINMTDKHMEFAEKYNMDPKTLELNLRMPHFMIFKYEFRALHEILELEFTKMLEQDIRFRKCKRCGKYFIMKGNYDTNYCDRVAEGQTRSCQDLAAQENYKAKAAENPALPIYSKYYKRYAARVRSRQIKEADFKKWKFQALAKRDECSDGKITVEEYVAWMEDYFPNRKPKE